MLVASDVTLSDLRFLATRFFAADASSSSSPSSSSSNGIISS
jgi:hypothetical protein